ncbi:MAG: TatD DNase family protein [Candidatus Parcubacteria bacterium]|jgi:TatD DNase family protein|nr:TatD DNase family protein [Candidatus Parcubacteria bacterium]
MKYIDVHGHLNFAAYKDDREEVIKRAAAADIGMITVGTQIDTSRAALELARAHPRMWAAVGLHPIHTNASHHDLQELGPEGKAFTSRGERVDVEAYRKLAVDPKVAAIGECGLDYYRLDDSTLALQKKTFEAMIDLANEVKKPLMLHIRNGSGTSAYREAYRLVKQRAKVRGNLHFFAGSVEEARPFVDLGYTFSFTGVITFARDYDEVIRYLPLDRIMSETDCPYVTPLPHRGKRNEPLYVIEVARMIAKIRSEDETRAGQQLIKNACDFFGIS